MFSIGQLNMVLVLRILLQLQLTDLFLISFKFFISFKQLFLKGSGINQKMLSSQDISDQDCHTNDIC